METCFIGIDPSFRKNGFAICVIDEDLTANFIKFIDVHGFVCWLIDAPHNAFYCIENSNLQNETFDMSGSKSIIAKKSRDVGKNMAISQITVDICMQKAGKENVLELSPLQKGKKITDNSIFLNIAHQERIKLLNYKGLKGEQDERDAFLLAIKAIKWKKIKNMRIV